MNKTSIATGEQKTFIPRIETEAALVKATNHFYSSLVEAVTAAVSEKVSQSIEPLCIALRRDETPVLRTYNRDQICTMFKISKQTLHCWMRDGKIPYKKAGKRTLFPAAEVDQMFDNGELGRYSHIK